MAPRAPSQANLPAAPNAQGLANAVKKIAGGVHVDALGNVVTK